MAFGSGGRLVLPLLLVCLSSVRSRSLKRRVEDLETQVNNNYAQTRLDIKELRDLISSLNSTEIADIDIGRTASGVPATDFQHLIQTMETFMSEQTFRSEALRRAFVEEKASKTKDKQQDVMKSQTENEYKAELNKSITNLQIQIHQEGTDRVSLGLELRSEINNLEKLMSECNHNIEKLENVINSASLQIINQGKQKDNNGPPCPPSWILNGNKFYYIVSNENADWEDAKLRCHNYGGILAEPETEEAVLFLFSNLYELSDNFWIGVSDEKKDRTWIFSTSKKELTFFRWARGQPNNYKSNQYCLEILLSAMNDDDCSKKQSFVCQMESYS